MALPSITWSLYLYIHAHIFISFFTLSLHFLPNRLCLIYFIQSSLPSEAVSDKEKLHITVFDFSSILFPYHYHWQWTSQLNAPLQEVDPEISNIIELEKARQWKVNIHSIFAYQTKFVFIDLIYIPRRNTLIMWYWCVVYEFAIWSPLTLIIIGNLINCGGAGTWTHSTWEFHISVGTTSRWVGHD